MDYRQLGRAGVKVSQICLGTGFRQQPDDKVCERIIHTALDLGCNFIDCANFYGRGRSETIVGKALKGRRDDVVLTTKVQSRIGEGPNDEGLSRFHIMREIDRSLKRLQMDHVDVYLLHNADADTPQEEILRAMNDVVRQGKATYVGWCNHPPWRLTEHLGICRAEGLAPPVVTQNQYNLLNRYIVEGDLSDVIAQYGLGLMTFSPLAVGLLSGLFRKGQTPPDGALFRGGKRDLDAALTDEVEAVLRTLAEVGAEVGKTPAQIAIAWILDHEQVTAAIIGPDLPEHAEEALGGAGWSLDPEQRARLDEVSSIELRRSLV
jgi:aryl-alcohol dehydrogenase-like predicted oxidoreductase